MLECVSGSLCVFVLLCVAACVCLHVCEIQTRREEGNSSGSKFYLKSCETLVNWLKVKRNLQGTDIRAINTHTQQSLCPININNLRISMVKDTEEGTT